MGYKFHIHNIIGVVYMPKKDINIEGDFVQPNIKLTEELLPKRFHQGNAGAFSTFLMGLQYDTIQSLADTMLWFQSVGHPNSPPDYLEFLNRQDGIVKFLGESQNGFRNRVLSKWKTLPFYSEASAIINSIEQTLSADSDIVQVNLLFDLPAVPAPVPPPKAGGFDIPAYPASTSHLSQFVVFVNLNKNISDGNIQTLSDVVSDAQLDGVRELVAVTKPVQWICREIVLFSVLSYDQPGIFYDQTDPELFYQDLVALTTPSSPGDDSNTVIFERHRGY